MKRAPRGADRNGSSGFSFFCGAVRLLVRLGLDDRRVVPNGAAKGVEDALVSGSGKPEDPT